MPVTFSLLLAVLFAVICHATLTVKAVQFWPAFYFSLLVGLLTFGLMLLVCCASDVAARAGRSR